MPSHPTVTPVAARRIPAMARSAGGATRRTRVTYRPLIVGAAVLERAPGQGGRWYTRVSHDGRLLPIAPTSRDGVLDHIQESEDAGLTCRVAAALLSAGDLMPDVTWRNDRKPPSIDFYGWALLYQLPSMQGYACVDPHEEFDDLPAFYESPLMLLDRAAFLAERGVLTRPLAVVTHHLDFDRDGDRLRRNRFFPEADCRPRCDCPWLE